MRAGTYNALTNNGTETLDHSLTEKLVGLGNSLFAQTLDNFVANDFNTEDAGDSDFVSNIFTNLIDAANEEGLIDLSSSDLEGGKIGIDNDTDYPGSAAANSTRSGGKHYINALLKPASLDEVKKDQFAQSSLQFWYLGNSGDAINILGVHEPLHAKYPQRGGGPRGHGGMNKEILSNKRYKKVLSIATSRYTNRVKKWANAK